MTRTGSPADALGIIACDPRVSDESGHGAFVLGALLAERCIVAELHGAVVGYAVWDDHFFGNRFLELLFVGERARRCGVGGALVRAFEETTQAPKVFTSTNESNAPMRALLDGLGWVGCGRIDHLDPGDPELIYVRLRPAVASGQRPARCRRTA